MSGTDVSFFEETRDGSIVKATIVEKYFSTWFKVINSQKPRRVAYIDLFCGPGRYGSGEASTPIRVLESAINDPILSKKLVTIFNDAMPESVEKLKAEFAQLENIDNLRFKPVVYNDQVGTEIAEYFEKLSLVPTLLFVDPWGYKGLSLRLVESVVKDWGCDCIFFFNYNRISMGVSNRFVREHMCALFGDERAEELAQEVKGKTPAEREAIIVEALASAFQINGKRYVLPFRFRNEKGTRTSHHLIFVSKHVLGYTLMKEIMAKESSGREQGVPSFEYSPSEFQQGLLFELSRPLDQLSGMIMEEFAGKKLTVKSIFDSHHVGRPFVLSNYKDALRKLEETGAVEMTPSAEKRRMSKGVRTLADHVEVSVVLFEEGDEVIHETYGEGSVLEVGEKVVLVAFFSNINIPHWIAKTDLGLSY